MKCLALDIGEKRIGLAVCDESGIVVSPLKYLLVGHDILTNLGSVIASENPKKVIFGIPRHASGEEAVFAEQIREFAKVVHHEYNIEVDFEDESGTTIEAEKRLAESGKNLQEIKELVDSESACVILESYLAR